MAIEKKRLSEEERVAQRSPELRALHKLFDAMKLANFRRAGIQTQAKRPSAKSVESRKAIREAWALAQSERHLEVACCHKCRAWFPSFEKRNAHRAIGCPKAKVA